MTFRLRGGRPKNMNQGIYWVQRHTSNMRTASARSRGDESRIERANQKAINFNEKWGRILDNVQFITNSENKGYNISFTISTSIEMSKSDEFNILVKKFQSESVKFLKKRNSINGDPEGANMRDLSTLSNYALKLVCLFLAITEKPFTLSEDRILVISGKDRYDFS